MKTPTRSALRDRITIDAALCNGKPTIRGKRITVQTVLEFLSAGESRDEILRQYPSLEAEDVYLSTALSDMLVSRTLSRRAQCRSCHQP